MNELEISANQIIATKVEKGKALSRFDRLLSKHKTAHKVIVLLDTSGSMASPANSVGERRIDALRGVVTGLRVRGHAFKQLVFNNDVMWSDVIPEPSGGTNLTAALEFVEKASPEHLIVVSDGEPDHDESATIVAKRLGCKIDVFFVGPKGSCGESFMGQLAKDTGGASETVSFKELEVKIAGILSAGPEDEQSKPIAL